MKLYSWNVNGIRAVQRKGYLQPFIEEHQPDILCFQETKVNHEQIDLDWPNFEKYWNSAEKAGYSGTAIFTRHTPLSVVNGFPADIVSKYKLVDKYGDTTQEGRVITAEFESFFVSTVYTPNAKDDLSRLIMRQQWDPAYLEYMKRLQQNKPVIFCGDLNVAYQPIDLARPKQNEGKKGYTIEERAGFSALLEGGFVDTLRHKYPNTPELYTWWSHFAKARERNVGWRIDYIMISERLLPALSEARIHPEIKGSDHCPVSIELQGDF